MFWGRQRTGTAGGAGICALPYALSQDVCNSKRVVSTWMVLQLQTFTLEKLRPKEVEDILRLPSESRSRRVLYRHHPPPRSVNIETNWWGGISRSMHENLKVCGCVCTRR